MYNFVDLTGKRIIVTGASSGIGRQTAITLSRLGAKLILVARREEQLRETLELMEGEGHGYCVMDLSQTEEIEQLIKQICADYGPLDGMAYVAGISKVVPLTQLSPQKVEREFMVNYFAFIEMIRQLSKRDRYHPGLRIVSVSSVASVCGDPAHTAYSGSKAAMDGSIRCMAKELAPKGIAINSVAPAMTDTAMLSGFKSSFGENSSSVDYLMKRQYLGFAQPQDIANAIAFLVSDAARFITGTCLFVDGGYTSC